MTTNDNMLPWIEDGTVKQKMFAEDVRLKAIRLVWATNDPKMYADFGKVIQTRVFFQWWIDRANDINLKTVKTMIKTTKAAITRAGSVEAAIEDERLRMEKRYKQYLEYKNWQYQRDMEYLDSSVEDEISMDGERERPF